MPATFAIHPGALSRLPEMLGTASRVLLVTNRHLGIDEHVLGDVEEARVIVWSGEPNIDVIDQLAEECQDFDAEVVVGIGGGSVMDAAKALAAAIPNRAYPLIDHLEVVGSGRPLESSPLPVIAVPTTAGTGSEMTKNAVLDIPSAKRKVSLRDPRLTPQAVIIDPNLSEGLPLAVASACALDASVQLVESFATPLANEESDRWALRGIENGLAAAERVVRGHSDADTRMDMAVAAMCSGAALAAAKLGTIHGFAGVVGGATGMGHGQLCGLFAGPVLRLTIERLVETAPGHRSLERYRILSGYAGVQEPNAAALADWFDDLVGHANFDRSALASLSEDERASVVTATAAASSTTGNPIPLSPEDLRRILDEVADA